MDVYSIRAELGEPAPLPHKYGTLVVHGIEVADGIFFQITLTLGRKHKRRRGKLVDRTSEKRKDKS